VVWDIGYGKSAVQYGNHLVEVAAKAMSAGSVEGLKIDIGFQEVWRDWDQVIATAGMAQGGELALMDLRHPKVS
jgi:hypothetical protein